jgi:hypothetical protein
MPPRALALAATLAVTAIVTATTPATAQNSDWVAWTASWENDSFAFLSDNRTDDLYTNGVRITLVRDPARNWAPADSLGRWWQSHGLFARGDRPATRTTALIVGQHFFTPSVITDFAVDPLDRPYGAFTYAGLRLDVTEDAASPWLGIPLRQQHSFEAALGLMGPAAAAEEVQTGVHVLRKSRVPKGWSHQLYNEAAIGVSYQWRGRLGWRYFDLTPHFGGYGGNVQTYGYAGLTARVGLNLSGFPALILAPTVDDVAEDRKAWELALVAGLEGRGFAHNAFIDGSLFQESPNVPRRAWVGDFRYGVTARVEEWRASLTMVRRSPEATDNGAFGGEYHDFGSISLAFEPGRATSGDREGTTWGTVYDEWLPYVLRHVVAEAGIGGGRSHVTPGATYDGSADGTAMRVGLGLSFFERVTLGWELGGVVREAEEPANPNAPHTDVFLVNNLLTASVVPLGTLRERHDFYVKGGFGSALRKLQVVPRLAGTLQQSDCVLNTTLDTDSDDRFCIREDEGSTWMFGGGYAYRLGQASIGIDMARYWQDLDDFTASPDFFTTTLTLRYHPGSRGDDSR